MGGRGSSSGAAARGGGGSVSETPEFKNAYNIEMENAMQFEAAYALDTSTTKEALGYQMHVHQEVTGNSLIADTQREVQELERAYKNANRDGASFGMSKEAIAGMKTGINEKISLRRQAIEKMYEAKTEYERYRHQAQVGKQKAKANPSWM